MSPLTWWKGVRLHTKADRGYYKPLTQIQDSQTPIITAFHLTELYTQDLVLWKAKVCLIYFLHSIAIAQ